MSPRNQAPKSCKSSAHRSLLITGESPLSHSPGCLVKCWASSPASNGAGYSPSYPVRNPESDSSGYPANYGAGYSSENQASSGEDCPDRNSASPSADCPDNRPERNPKSNRENDAADNSPDDSESDLVDSLPDCSASHVPGFRRHPAGREPPNPPTPNCWLLSANSGALRRLPLLDSNQKMWHNPTQA